MSDASSQPSNARRAGLNPFAHIFRGSKNALSTNFTTALLTTIITFVVGIVLSFLAVFLLFKSVNNISFTGGGMGTFFAGLLGFVAIVVVVQSYFEQVLNRVVLTGTRKQHITLRMALQIAGQRFGITLLCILVVVGLILAAGIVLGILGSMAPALGTLVGLAELIVGIVLTFRFIFTPFVLIDDERPAGVKASFRRSAALWHKSQGAVVLYVLLFVAVYIVFAILSNHHHATYTAASNDPFANIDTSTSTSSNSLAAAGTSVLALVISSIVGTVVTVVASAGLAAIYNDAKVAAGESPEDSSAPLPEQSVPQDDPNTPPSVGSGPSW